MAVGEQESAVAGSHGWQVLAAPVPQVFGKLGAMHTPLAQQPVGQDWALHTHAPPWHAVPGPQAGPPPHWQVPVRESQLSVVSAGQAWQVPPPTPQARGFPVLHTPLAQQPFGQDPASQTQMPATHVVPGPQAALPPQVQRPMTEQLSARAASHGTQAAPIAPQLVSDRGVHVEPAQQPVGQLPTLHPLHTPFEQAPVPQSWQRAPPTPHVLAAVPGWQVMPSQQPRGHEVTSQMQLPFTQRCPSLQAAPVPQRHDPVALQASAAIPQSLQTPPA